jgi:hypothetical protein
VAINQNAQNCDGGFSGVEHQCYDVYVILKVSIRHPNRNAVVYGMSQGSREKSDRYTNLGCAVQAL